MRLIAYHTFLGFWRKKVFFIFFFSYILLMFLGLFLGDISLSEQQKIVVDFLLMGMEILGVILIVFFASKLIYNEMRDKTLDLLRLKLDKSYYFFVGKFLGFFMVLFLFFLVTFVLFSFFFLLKYHYGIAYVISVWAIFFVFIKLVVLFAFVMFFSVFLSPVTTLLVSLLVYILSHSTAFLNYYYHSLLMHKNIFIEYVMSGLYYILPNFAQLSLRGIEISSVDLRFFLMVLFVNVLYVFVLLFLGIIVYSKRVKHFI